VLRELEMLRMKGKAVETDVRAVIKKYAMDDLADDNLSHFLLRLVYCRKYVFSSHPFWVYFISLMLIT
jgi:hypothetical protein